MFFRHIILLIFALVLCLVSASPVVLSHPQAPSVQTEQLRQQAAKTPLFIETTVEQDEPLARAQAKPNETSSPLTEQTSAKSGESFIHNMFQKFTGRATTHVPASHSTGALTPPIRRRFSARVARRRHPRPCGKTLKINGKPYEDDRSSS
ncbi:hypothetical protein D9619_007893 [Psilocybe cf. subviscida]|uniref:Uncharacterized protein n=1 Tax=Psilocybe cf. subviscida TaxID=2480587 RepID=A0A8H5ESH8_9AGAR|nr:hypothetical protein D9619_007893 [Psilocybe cf. subviscida]